MKKLEDYCDACPKKCNSIYFEIVCDDRVVHEICGAECALKLFSRVLAALDDKQSEATLFIRRIDKKSA